MNLGRIHAGASVRFRPVVLNADGSVARVYPERRNLILDQGLDLVDSLNWHACISRAEAGTGTAPTARDSAEVTFTAVAGVVTASDGFFEVADVGRLLRLDSGEEGYISSYSSTTVVGWTGVDAGPAQGTVHYVNRTALGTFVKASETYLTATGQCGHSWNVSTKTRSFWRTFIFSAETGSVTYTELGWGDSATNVLFGLALLDAGGVAVGAGQQLTVRVQLDVTLSPAAPVAVGNVGTGWNTAGQASLRCILAASSGVHVAMLAPDTNGTGSVSSRVLESLNGAGFEIAIFSSTFDLSAGAVNAAVTSPTALAVLIPTVDAYVPGSFTKTIRATFGVGVGTGTVAGVGLKTTGIGTDYLVFGVLFTTPQTKAADYKVTLVFRYTWGRSWA